MPGSGFLPKHFGVLFWFERTSSCVANLLMHSLGGMHLQDLFTLYPLVPTSASNSGRQGEGVKVITLDKDASGAVPSPDSAAGCDAPQPSALHAADSERYAVGLSQMWLRSQFVPAENRSDMIIYRAATGLAPTSSNGKGTGVRLQLRPLQCAG